MERKEPTLSGNSSPTPERDDSGARRPSESARTSRPASTSSASSNNRSAPTGYATPTSGGSPLAIIALVVAVVGVGLGGFFGFKLTQTQTMLQQADARIAELEGKLDLTSDQSSQSLTQVDAKLKWADSEIRKLWGVANDVNRKAIAANKENIASVAKELAGTKKTASAAKSAADALDTQLAANKASVDNAVAKIDEAVLGIAEQRKRLQDFTEQLDRVESDLNSLNSLKDKMKTNEEAIAAIDAYRRTTNREILQIKEQLGIINGPQ